MVRSHRIQRSHVSETKPDIPPMQLVGTSGHKCHDVRQTSMLDRDSNPPFVVDREERFPRRSVRLRGLGGRNSSFTGGVGAET